jgi:hypothetical protein
MNHFLPPHILGSVYSEYLSLPGYFGPSVCLFFLTCVSCFPLFSVGSLQYLHSVYTSGLLLPQPIFFCLFPPSEPVSGLSPLSLLTILVPLTFLPFLAFAFPLLLLTAPPFCSSYHLLFEYFLVTMKN